MVSERGFKKAKKLERIEKTYWTREFHNETKYCNKCTRGIQKLSKSQTKSSDKILNI